MKTVGKKMAAGSALREFKSGISKNMKKIKVGVIGVGYLGKFHARKYAAMQEAELVGVADVDFAAASRVAEDCATKPFGDYMRLLDEVDAVSIVVPTTLHYQVARACIEKNVDMMIEKPMTGSLTEADELIERSDEKKLIIQVGLLERYNPAVLAMDEYLAKPLFIESHRIHTFKSRGVDVDVVLDLMIHDIDIILSIVDSPIKNIHAVGVPVVTPATDIANARLIFENGCTANVTVSRIAQDNIRRIRVFQQGSFISVDYGKKEMTYIRQEQGFDESGQPKREVVHSCYMEKDALETELTDFVANVRNRSTPMVSGLEGRRAQAVAMEIIDQLQKHAQTHADLLKV